MGSDKEFAEAIAISDKEFAEAIAISDKEFAEAIAISHKEFAEIAVERTVTNRGARSSERMNCSTCK